MFVLVLPPWHYEEVRLSFTLRIILCPHFVSIWALVVNNVPHQNNNKIFLFGRLIKGNSDYAVDPRLLIEVFWTCAVRLLLAAVMLRVI